MGVFEWLEGTSLALWVGESLWGYPIMLSLHVVGLAIVVGIFLMRDLCLLGMFDGIEHGSLTGLVKLGWIGFLVNALSGAAWLADRSRQARVDRLSRQRAFRRGFVQFASRHLRREHAVFVENSFDCPCGDLRRDHSEPLTD